MTERRFANAVMLSIVEAYKGGCRLEPDPIVHASIREPAGHRGRPGILCHVLFSVAVATMIMAMFFGMSRSLGQVPAHWSALVNALLLAQFPFLHSLLLSPFGATLLTRLAPAAIGS